jgi:hypothetical protein
VSYSALRWLLVRELHFYLNKTTSLFKVVINAKKYCLMYMLTLLETIDEAHRLAVAEG